MNQSAQHTFLITGVNSGFGKAFADAALDAGHIVFGTVRSEAARAGFEQSAPGLAHGVLLDVTDFAAIPATIAHVIDQAGHIDVLINNAGYGHEGTVEESPLDELIHQFNVNVFGAVAMIKAVLPSMRERRRGHIFNLTSMAGFTTFPGIAYYCGSKFALEGIGESLAKEVAGFGIKVTNLGAGSFRTDWAGRSMVRSARTIVDYDKVFDPIRRARAVKSGKQAGDPIRAAQVVLDIIENDKPPVHLLLGNDALAVVREKLASLSAEIDTWESVSASTDF